MIYRILMGAGLFILGYYLGKEVDRKQLQNRQTTHKSSDGKSARNSNK
jgi:hypothetical protein